MSGRSSVNSDLKRKITSEGLTRPAPVSCPQLAPGYSGPCHKGHAKCLKALRRYEARQRTRGKAS